MKKILIFALLFFAHQTLASETPLEKGVKAYANGRYLEARTIFESLSVKDNAEAQYNLATMYLYGKGVKPDAKKAYEWFSRSANNNYAKSQYMAGYMLENGLGTPKDLKKAFRYYTEASKSKYPFALYALGRFYETGISGKKDMTKAKELYKRAAAKGSTAAAYKMGKILEKENKIEQALQWYDALIQASYIPATEARKALCNTHKQYCKKDKENPIQAKDKL